MSHFRSVATLVLAQFAIAIAVSACSGAAPSPDNPDSDTSAVDASEGDTATDDTRGDPDLDSAQSDTTLDDVTEDAAGDATSDVSTPETVYIEERLRGVVDDSELPSLVAAVADGTRLRAIGAVGVRSIDDAALVLEGDPYHLGSDTKAMTATLAARYVELGTLRWDSTVAELFPNLAVDPGFDGVTVTDLLSHIGGAPPSLAAVMGQAGWVAAFSDESPLDEQRASVVADILQAPPSIAPGTFSYSNAGYVIVGAALEQLTGETWEDLMRAQVFEPLGMDDCGFGPPRDEREEAPVGHVMNGAIVEVAADAPYNDNPALLGPAGTVYCNASSWLPFLQAHLRSDDGDYLSAASWEELHRPNSDGYALGWGVGDRSWADGAVFSHSGSNTMWFAVAWVAPNIDRIYFAMTNIASPNTALILDGVISDLIGDSSL